MKPVSLLALILPLSLNAQNYVSVSTFAGASASGYVNSSLLASRFNSPYGICFDDQAGAIYVADAFNNRIRKIQNGSVTTVAGSGLANDIDGQGLNAAFDTPTGVFWKNGILYICDNLNNKIKQMDAQGNVTTVAGSGLQGFQDGPVSVAAFYQPKSIAVDNNGVIYVADYENHRIRKIENGMVSTVAGTGAAGDDTGPALSADLHRPRDLCVAPDGTLYFVDLMNHKVKRLTTNGVVELVAGSGVAGGGDGNGSSAQFNIPVAIDWLSSTELVVLDAVNPKLRRVTTAGVVTTIAGSGIDGYLDGAPLVARFDLPQDVCRGVGGDIYISDRNNNCIRVLDNDVSAESITENMEPVQQLLNSPNPTSSVTTIDLSHIPDPLTGLLVYDEKGALVLRLEQGDLAGFGRGLATIDATGWPAGQYAVLVSTRSRSYRSVFIKE